MKHPARRFASCLVFATLLLSACVKPLEEVEAPKPAPEPFAGVPAAPNGPPSVAGIPAAAIAAAERAKAKVEVASTATLDNGAIFKQAKEQFAQKQYAEARRTLDTIQAELLSPPQEKAVAELRAQINQALGQ